MLLAVWRLRRKELNLKKRLKLNQRKTTLLRAFLGLNGHDEPQSLLASLAFCSSVPHPTHPQSTNES